MKIKVHCLSVKPEAERHKTKGSAMYGNTSQALQKMLYLYAVSKRIPHLPAGWQQEDSLRKKVIGYEVTP